MSKEKGIKVFIAGKEIGRADPLSYVQPDNRTIYTIGDTSTSLDKIKEKLMEGVKKENKKAPVISLQILLDDGVIVKIGKHQLFKDGEYYVVEKYEYTDEFSNDMFSVVDAYKELKKALGIIATL